MDDNTALNKKEKEQYVDVVNFTFNILFEEPDLTEEEIHIRASLNLPDVSLIDFASLREIMVDRLRVVGKSRYSTELEYRMKRILKIIMIEHDIDWLEN